MAAVAVGGVGECAPRMQKHTHPHCIPESSIKKKVTEFPLLLQLQAQEVMRDRDVAEE